MIPQELNESYSKKGTNPTILSSIYGNVFGDDKSTLKYNV